MAPILRIGRRRTTMWQFLLKLAKTCRNFSIQFNELCRLLKQILSWSQIWKYEETLAQNTVWDILAGRTKVWSWSPWQPWPGRPGPLQGPKHPRAVAGGMVVGARASCKYIVKQQIENDWTKLQEWSRPRVYWLHIWIACVKLSMKHCVACKQKFSKCTEKSQALWDT